MWARHSQGDRGRSASRDFYIEFIMHYSIEMLNLLWHGHAMCTMHMTCVVHITHLIQCDVHVRIRNKPKQKKVSESWELMIREPFNGTSVACFSRQPLWPMWNIGGFLAVALPFTGVQDSLQWITTIRSLCDCQCDSLNITKHLNSCSDKRTYYWIDGVTNWHIALYLT